jgi:hypothetical protein
MSPGRRLIDYAHFPLADGPATTLYDLEFRPVYKDHDEQVGVSTGAAAPEFFAKAHPGLAVAWLLVFAGGAGGQAGVNGRAAGGGGG